MNTPTNNDDRRAERDAARDARYNDGDWPTSNRRPSWIERRAKTKRRATTCAWYHEGLRLSLAVWLSNRAYDCGQPPRMNLAERKAA